MKQKKEIAYLIGRWIKLETSRNIRSKNPTFKAFHMATYISLTLKKVISVKLLWVGLVFVRADNISLVCL
jgi:hypothetical protein